MKKQYLIEVAITMILLVGVVLFKFLPEYRQEYGSSDSLIYTDLSRLVEIKIDGVDFGYAYNDENKVRAIIFFNNNSTVLYNKNIENLSIDEALTKSLDILYNDKILVLSTCSGDMNTERTILICKTINKKIHE